MQRWILAAAAAVLMCGQAVGARAGDTIFQYSTLDALKAGVFDGQMTFGELERHGDLGLGTVNALDGELIGFDGHFWRITHDGVVHAVTPDEKTPFAAVVHFHRDKVVEVPAGLDAAGLGGLLDLQLADHNTPVSIRIDGHFAMVKLRAPERQTKPYPVLAKALANEAEWTYRNIDGTLVGFWFPSWLGGLNAATWHFHFLSADKKVGGHVLALETGAASAALDPSPGLDLVLPQSPAFAGAVLPAGQ